VRRVSAKVVRHRPILKVNAKSDKQMTIIGWFSGGIASAVACKLAIDEYGADNVWLYFMETGMHHKDMQRFIGDLEEWAGTHVIQVQNRHYKDPHEVFRKTGYVNGPAGARCTLDQKKQVRYDIEAEYEFDHQIFGFDFSKAEINRGIRFKQQYPYTNPLFPLIDKQITKSECLGIIKRAGIETPKMYQLGYHNNNCIGCVKGGKGYWNKIREDFPEYFEKMKESERITGRTAIKGKFLENLDPDEGRHEEPIVPSCGVVCRTEFEHIESPKVDQVMEGQMSIYDV